jgi:hypothetical protein
MSKARDVIIDLRALIQSACPYARVTGFEKDGDKPTRSTAGGDIYGHSGNVEVVDTDLSPLTYHVEHSVPIEVAAPEGCDDDGAFIDLLMGQISNGVRAEAVSDRLGCKIDWMECRPAEIDDVNIPGVEALRWAAFAIVLHYSTTDLLN